MFGRDPREESGVAPRVPIAGTRAGFPARGWAPQRRTSEVRKAFNYSVAICGSTGRGQGFDRIEVLSGAARAMTSTEHSSLESQLSSDRTLTRMADALRVLAMDAVQQANSGHPGMPMGMAEIAVALWARHLRHNPADPPWPDRDRFVLSNGHGSMLLYSLLHLTGYALPIVRAEKPSGSCTRRRRGIRKSASRPASKPPPARWGRAGQRGRHGAGRTPAGGPIQPRRLTRWSITSPMRSSGDGCLMEGISHEVCSLAGTLGCPVWSCSTTTTASRSTARCALVHRRHVARFQAYGWHVIADIDGHDTWAVDRAITQAREWARQRPGRPVCAHADSVPHGDRQGLSQPCRHWPRRTASPWVRPRSPWCAKPWRHAASPSPGQVPEDGARGLGRP
jgi:hypothetical protein